MAGHPDIPPPIPDEHFLRYWDDMLTEAELTELAELLRTDPAARERFQLLCEQVVALGEQACRRA
jgi:hypothetical protein